MLRARGGDREAFAALYDRWAGPLRRWLLVARYARPEDVDDLVQAAFLRVWRAAGTYEVRARFSTFLFQVAENHLRNERDLRWNRSRPASLDAPGGADDEAPSLAESLPGDDPCPGRDAAEREERARLRAAVARLPVHLREVVLLGAVEGRPYAEVAETLGVPVGTVKRRMFDAVRLLRQRLGAREGREP